MIEGPAIELLESSTRCMGICKGLKIGDELPGSIPLLEKCTGPDNLFIDGKTVITVGPCPRAAGITKDTSLMGNAAITVRAIQARIQRYLLDTLPKYLPQITIKIAESLQGNMLQYSLGS